MLMHPVIQRLQQLNLRTMAMTLRQQQESPLMTELAFEERQNLKRSATTPIIREMIGLIVDNI